MYRERPVSMPDDKTQPSRTSDVGGSPPDTVGAPGDGPGVGEGGRARVLPETDTRRRRIEEAPRPLWKRLAEVVLMVAAAFALAMLIQAFVVKPYVVPTGSMIPTIQLNDRVLCDRITFHFREPRVGDIVVFENPMSGGIPLVKRVLGVGGQTLEIKQGYVYLDGIMLEEPYIVPERRGTYTSEGPIHIPEGELWMMGDNRIESGDSRYFGSMPVESVLGRAFFTYWPPSHLGALR